MRYNFHNSEGLEHLTHHQFYYYPGSFTWQLWQIISLVLGILFVCFLVGICLTFLRRSGFAPGGAYGTTARQPIGGVYI